MLSTVFCSQIHKYLSYFCLACMINVKTHPIPKQITQNYNMWCVHPKMVPELLISNTLLCHEQTVCDIWNVDIVECFYIGAQWSALKKICILTQRQNHSNISPLKRKKPKNYKTKTVKIFLSAPYHIASKELYSHNIRKQTDESIRHINLQIVWLSILYLNGKIFLQVRFWNICVDVSVC